MSARTPEIVHDADAPRDAGLAPDALAAQLARTWDIPGLARRCFGAFPRACAGAMGRPPRERALATA